MLRRIVEIFAKIPILPKNNISFHPMLGRWCILNREYNNRKIDLANIDHCGTCKFDSIKGNTSNHVDKSVVPIRKE